MKSYYYAHPSAKPQALALPAGLAAARLQPGWAGFCARATGFLLLALAFSWRPALAQGASLTVTPATITNDFRGQIVLSLSGLSAGQTVRIEKYADFNGNGVIDTGEPMIQSFTVTDGQAPTVGGVRNLNMAGDEDGAANGQIQAKLFHPWVDAVLDSAVGNFIYKVSDAASGAALATQKFSITARALPQGVTGVLTANGNPQPNAPVFLFPMNAPGANMVFSDANGRFLIYAPPGNYGFAALRNGFVSGGSAAAVTITANQFSTNNLALTAASLTVSGQITDSATGKGLPGLFVMAQQKTNHVFTGNLTDANGAYSFQVTPGPWALGVKNAAAAQLGYLGPGGKLNTNLTASTVINLGLPKATALIYGTLQTSSGTPLLGIEVDADPQSGMFGAQGRTFPPNGSFTLGVTADSWSVQPSSDDPGLAGIAVMGTNVTVNAGQAVQASFLGQAATTHLRGKVVDNTGAPVADLSVYVNPVHGGPSSGNIQSGSDGSFDIAVSGGNWNLSADQEGAATRGLIAPSLTLMIIDGVDQDNLLLVLQKATAQISGTLKDNTGNPIAGIGIYAFLNANGTNYNNYVQTDGTGHYQFPVFNGSWQVGVNCGGSDNNSLSGLGYQCVDNQAVNISGNNGTANFVAQKFVVTAHLRGKVVDNTGAAVANLPVYAWPNNGNSNSRNSQTGADGGFDLGVFGGTWTLSVDQQFAAMQGLAAPSLTLNVVDGADQNNLLVVLQKFTVQITGTLKDSAGNPIAGIGLYASTSVNGTNYDANGQTDSTGAYQLPAFNATWQISVNCGGSDSSSLSGLGYQCVDNQTVNISGSNGTANFVARKLVFTVHLRGKVVDNTGAAVANLAVNVWPNNGNSNVPGTQTGSDGSFDLGVLGGAWTLSVDQWDAAARGLAAPSLTLNVVDGVDQTNLLVVLQKFTVQITGTLKDSAGKPIAGIQLEASTSLSGTNYNSEAQTDSTGAYQLRVFNATWQVSVSCSSADSWDLSGRGYQCVPEQTVVIAGQNGTANFVAQPAAAGGPDVANFSVAKGQVFLQTGNSAPAPDPSRPYGFHATVQYAAQGTVNGASVRLPNGSSLNLSNDQGAATLDQSFKSRTNLDAAFPDGSYTLTMDTVHDGTKTANLSLTGDFYPAAPQINNFSALQGVSPGQSVLVSWNALAGGAANDFVQLQISDTNGMTVFTTPYPGATGALNGQAISVSVPSGLLGAGQFYLGTLLFAKVVAFDTNDYPGSVGASAYYALTEFPLTTSGAVTTGPDVSRYILAKGQVFIQTTNTAPTPDPSQPFEFDASVNLTAPGGVTNATLRLPNASTQTLANHTDSWELQSHFTNQAALDAAYPSGSYLLTINAVHDGAKSAGLALGPPAYPNAPQLSNFAAAQTINAQNVFTLSWSPFNGGTKNDYAQLRIEDDSGDDVFTTPEPGQPGALDGTITSVTVAPGQLSGGQTYRGELLFAKLSALDTNDYPGALGVSGYFARTQFTLKTVGASAAPDVSFFVVSKAQEFIQTDNTAPAPKPGQPYRFQAFVNMAASGSVNSAIVLPPSGSPAPLTLYSDSLELKQNFTNQAALDTAFPNGAYGLMITANHDGIKSATLALTGNLYPNAPQISNLVAVQSMDLSQAIVLSWAPLAGGTTQDYIRLEITDTNGHTVFATGNPGDPAALNGTALSVTVPSHTLTSGQLYEGTLLFAKVTALDTTDYPGAVGLGGYVAQTRFSLHAPAIVVSAPRWLPPQHTAGVFFQAQLQVVTGQTYTLETSTNLFTWSSLLTTNVATNIITLTYPSPIQGASRVFFRARVGSP